MHPWHQMERDCLASRCCRVSDELWIYAENRACPLTTIKNWGMLATKTALYYCQFYGFRCNILYQIGCVQKTNGDEPRITKKVIFLLYSMHKFIAGKNQPRHWATYIWISPMACLVAPHLQTGDNLYRYSIQSGPQDSNLCSRDLRVSNFHKVMPVRWRREKD